MNFSSLKNIIFDLGGVIINIDFQRTFEAFAELGQTDILTTLKKFEELRVFERYEEGEFTDSEFRTFLKEKFSAPVSDFEIDKAWNALLKDIPSERIRLIEKLKQDYNIFLLSNTNHIHFQKVNEILYESSGVRSLNDLFHKVYLSYEMKMSKPHLEIYETVLYDQKIKPEETLFIDDNKDNIEGAKAVGINAIYLQSPQTILEILKDA